MSINQQPSDSHYSQGQEEGESFKPTFTQEEIRVLKECNLESFYYRCVPLAAFFSTSTYLAINKGYLSKSARFGYTPKLMGAAVFGYILGKLSYQNACATKLMNTPNSPLGEALRKRSGMGKLQESIVDDTGFSQTYSSSDILPYEPPVLEDPRPDSWNKNVAMDDYDKVQESLSNYSEEQKAEFPINSSSYIDLRKQNREDYIYRMAEKYKKSNSDATPDPSSSPQPARRGANLGPLDSKGLVKRNEYGDVWEE